MSLLQGIPDAPDGGQLFVRCDECGETFEPLTVIEALIGLCAPCVADIAENEGQQKEDTFAETPY